MEWFNWYGLGAMLCILLPNALYAMRARGVQEHCRAQWLLVVETIARFACFALMVVRIPELGMGFATDATRVRWLWTVGALIALYWAFWGLYAWRGPRLWSALPLALLPCAVFCLTGLWMRLPPLTVSAAVFAVAHTAVTLINVRAERANAPKAGACKPIEDATAGPSERRVGQGPDPE